MRRCRLVFASKDDAAQQGVPTLTKIAEGGSNSLFDANAEGIKLLGRYGAYAQHTMFYIVGLDDVNALQSILWPGFKRCTAITTPVSEVAVPRD